MSIELFHLRYVLAAAEHGSFRRAADAMDVHQSALSRRIRDLEDEIGAALFIRQSSGVILTYAGKRFVPRIRRVLDEISHATLDIGSIGRGEEGEVVIGIFSSLSSGFLPNLLKTFICTHTDVKVRIIEGAPTEHMAAVRRNRLDVAFVAGLQALEECDSARFWSERVYVVLPENHALAILDRVTWHDLRGQSFIVSESDPGPEIYDYLIKHLADLGAHPSIDWCGLGRDNLMRIVSFGQGLTLTSEATIATKFPGVVYRPLDGEILPFSAVWSPRNDNPAFRRLLSLARKMKD